MSSFFVFSSEGGKAQKEYPVFKKLSAILLSALLALSLFSCSKPQKQSSNSSELTAIHISESSADTSVEISASEHSEADMTAPDTKYPLTFRDSYDNEMTLESEPKRIVSCAPNMTELIFQLGAEDRLVGRSDFCDYPDSVSSIESIGAIDSPSIETIIEMDPDLVLASSIFTEDTYNQLTGLGIKVIVIHEEYDVEGVSDMIMSVGEILNCNEKASELTEEMNSLIADVQASVEGLEKPTVYYAVSFGEYGDYTVGGDTYLHQLIEAAGGENIAKDVVGWSYSVEALVEADPDIILVNQYLLDIFLTTAPYSDLTAVKEGSVYGIDSNLLERQGFRNAQGILMLSELFHPEAN